MAAVVGIFRIGDWTVFPVEGVIEQGTERRNLRPKSMDFLLLLAESPGVTVTKDEIMGRLWAETVVEEGALSRCVSELRAALDDSPRQPRYIQTRHRRGYRLVATVGDPVTDPPETSGATEPTVSAASVLDSSPVEAGAGPTEGVSSSVPPFALALRHRLATRPWPGITLALGISAMVVLAIALLRPDAQVSNPSTAAPDAERSAQPRVVVLSLTHLDADASLTWIGRAAAHLLTTELAATTSLRLVPADLSGRAEGTLALARADTLPLDTLAQLRTRFDVDLVVTGHYVRSAEEVDDLRLDVMVTDAASGEIRAAVVEHGPPGRLGEIVTLAAAQLREGLGLAHPTALSSVGVASRSALPAAYFQGLEHLERLAAEPARVRFEHAIAEAPQAAWPRLGLAEAWALLGHDRKAAEGGAEALERIESLAGEERLWLEARAYALAGDWQLAFERFRALRLLEPANLEYGLAFIAALVDAGHMAEAAKRAAEATAGLTDGESDPRLILLEGEIALNFGAHQGARDAARKVVASSRALRAPSIEARARFLEARALVANGEVKAAITALDLAQRRFALAGDRMGEARTQVVLSGWLSNRGEHQQAEAIARSALAASRGIGDRTGEAEALLELGPQVWIQRGRKAGEPYLRRALALARETGDRAAEAKALSSLATALAHSTVDTPIMPLLREALTIYRALGHRERIGESLTHLGRVALQGGHLHEAAAYYDEAYALQTDLAPATRALIAFNRGYALAVWGDVPAAWKSFQQATVLFFRLGNAIMVDASVEALGETALSAGEIADATVYARASLRSRQARGEAVSRVAESKVVLSRVLLASGQAGEAERYAREALAASGKPSARSVRPAAVEALARVLLEAGRPREAKQTISALGEVDAARWQSLDAARGALTRARIESALGEHAVAAVRAQALHDDFSQRGAEALRLEAEWVLLEIDHRRTARVDVAEARRLEIAAREAGLELLAQKVRALASPQG